MPHKGYEDYEKSQIELQIELLKLLQKHWSQVISLDMETHVLSRNHFLKGERILSISLARRVSGNFMEKNGIEIETLFLEEYNDDSEKELITNLNKKLSTIRPLGVIGYGLRWYDIPLLVIKKRHYELRLKESWELVKMTECAIHVELYHLLRYKGYERLDDALSSQEFVHLPLERTRDLVSRDKKGEEIFQLWKKDKERLRKYTEGEVHDILLIAEELAFGKTK